MADEFTPTLNLTKPEINASPDTWGNKTNTNWDKVDADAAATDAAVTALQARCTALEAEAAKASFVGEIRMWSGTIADISNIPGGVWKLCDGSNGTHDLRDRFIIGAGNAYPPAATGGAASWAGRAASTELYGLRAAPHQLNWAEMPKHRHYGTTGQAGAHTHLVRNIVLANEGAGIQGGSSLNSGYGDREAEWAGQHGHDFVTDEQGADGAHDHALPDLSHDHSVSVPTLPPYYALAFIRRMS